MEELAQFLEENLKISPDFNSEIFKVKVEEFLSKNPNLDSLAIKTLNNITTPENLATIQQLAENSEAISPKQNQQDKVGYILNALLEASPLSDTEKTAIRSQTADIQTNSEANLINTIQELVKNIPENARNTSEEAAKILESDGVEQIAQKAEAEFLDNINSILNSFETKQVNFEQTLGAYSNVVEDGFASGQYELDKNGIQLAPETVVEISQRELNDLTNTAEQVGLTLTIQNNIEKGDDKLIISDGKTEIAYDIQFRNDKIELGRDPKEDLGAETIPQTQEVEAAAPQKRNIEKENPELYLTVKNLVNAFQAQNDEGILSDKDFQAINNAIRGQSDYYLRQNFDSGEIEIYDQTYEGKPLSETTPLGTVDANLEGKKQSNKKLENFLNIIALSANSDGDAELSQNELEGLQEAAETFGYELKVKNVQGSKDQDRIEVLDRDGKTLQSQNIPFNNDDVKLER